MIKFFANQKIGTRINAGFGAVMTLIAALAVMSWFELSHLRGNFDKYANMASDALLVSEIDGDMGELRLNVRRFMTTNDDADLEGANTVYKQVRHDIELAHKEIQNPVRAKLINEVDAHSVAYHKVF